MPYVKKSENTNAPPKKARKMGMEISDIAEEKRPKSNFEN